MNCSRIGNNQIGNLFVNDNLISRHSENCELDKNSIEKNDGVSDKEFLVLHVECVFKNPSGSRSAPKHEKGTNSIAHCVIHLNEDADQSKKAERE